MGEKRFLCTACGRCCNGILPVTIAEGLKWAHLFPMAVSILPVRPGTRGVAVLDRVGVAVELPGKKKLLLQVMPVSFVPPNVSCPALDGNLCSIHAEKPLRCRAMPFYPFKDEEHQLELLIPRSGWLCETGEEAPVVYKDRKIVERHDYAAERAALFAQAPLMNEFVKHLFKTSPLQANRIIRASQSTMPQRVIVSFASLLRRADPAAFGEFAKAQISVLEAWAERTKDDQSLVEFQGYYRDALDELMRHSQVS